MTPAHRFFYKDSSRFSRIKNVLNMSWDKYASNISTDQSNPFINCSKLLQGAAYITQDVSTTINDFKWIIFSYPLKVTFIAYILQFLHLCIFSVFKKIVAIISILCVTYPTLSSDIISFPCYRSVLIN